MGGGFSLHRGLIPTRMLKPIVAMWGPSISKTRRSDLDHHVTRTTQSANPMKIARLRLVAVCSRLPFEPAGPRGRSGIQRCTPGCPFPTLGMPTPSPPCRKDRLRSIQRLRIALRLPILLPVVTVPEYSLPFLKSRRRLPECLPVPLRYREAFENSPGIRPQRRANPQHSVPPLPFH